MSKARIQSVFRAVRRGNRDQHGDRITVSSTKVTKSGKSLTTVYRKGKFILQLPKKELERRKYLELRKLKAA